MHSGASEEEFEAGAIFEDAEQDQIQFWDEKGRETEKRMNIEVTVSNWGWAAILTVVFLHNVDIGMLNAVQTAF